MTFQYTMKAHETRYAGTLFRSRLEARWAALFDILRWRWNYEPLDLKGWSPDFTIEAGGKNLFVEIKPFNLLAEEHFDDLRALALKAARGAPCADVILLGVDPEPRLTAPSTDPGFGVLVRGSRAIPAPPRPRFIFSPTWLAFGKHGPDVVDPFLVSDALADGEIKPAARGVLTGEKVLDWARIPNAPRVAEFWREAGNRVQWKPSPQRSGV